MKILTALLILSSSSSFAQTQSNGEIYCDLNGLTDAQDVPTLLLTNVFGDENPTATLLVYGPNPTNLPPSHLNNVKKRIIPFKTGRLSQSYISIIGKAAAGCKRSDWEDGDEIEIRFYPAKNSESAGLVVLESSERTQTGECRFAEE